MGEFTIIDAINDIMRAINTLDFATASGSCREYSLTKTKLEEALMWAEKGYEIFNNNGKLEVK